MRQRWYLILFAGVAAAVIAAQLPLVWAEEGIDEGSAGASKWAPAVDPKPLSENVLKGLAWLIEIQHENGGWSQGEESPSMGRTAPNIRDVPNIADTCVATLSLIRAGSTPSKGPHSENIRRALGFICSEVEATAEEDSLFITRVRGTRVQSKLGPYIDTFLAAMLLAEVKDSMPDKEGADRVLSGLDTVMDKIERYQKEDGTWDDRGWAPVLSQAMAGKAVNRAAQVGYAVSERVRERVEEQAKSQFDKKTGSFDREGSAGVDLYSSGAILTSLRESDSTNAELEAEYSARLASATNEAARREAREVLARFSETNEALNGAEAAVVAKLDDKAFISGFGSNGGEEFLSYLNIGESLVVKGGEEWEQWDRSMAENLNRIQNADGSWTGHHCITGRTFCTATALLVLTVDRAPVPVAAKIKRR
jgi:hypothetical protein